MNVIPHYRAKCVDDFKAASEGSINLEKYADEFRDAAQIEKLVKKINELTSSGFIMENSESLSETTRKLDHEISRAIFPYRYLRYGTSIFGSARLATDSPEFKEVTDIARGLVAEARIDITTGGGPGVMKAANLGLEEAVCTRTEEGKTSKAKNQGLTIKLPFEENPNSHLDLTNGHSTFGSRLNEFADRSNSSISWDGGGGTDLENGFIYQLKQVRHIEEDFPLILKRSAWEPIQEIKMKTMYHEREAADKTPLVSLSDLDHITYADNPDDAIQAVLTHYKN